MTWEEFFEKAEEAGLEGDCKIDAIEPGTGEGNAKGFSICYTDSTGYEGVVEIRGD